MVILLSGFTRVQIIPGSLYGYKEVSCIDCCDSDGKVSEEKFMPKKQKGILGLLNLLWEASHGLVNQFCKLIRY